MTGPTEPRPSLPRYLARLAGSHPPGSGPALTTTYAIVTRRPFASAFGRFAVWVFDEYATRLTPLRSLAAGDRTTGRVDPLAIHYLRLTRSTRSVSVRFVTTRDLRGIRNSLAANSGGTRSAGPAPSNARDR